MLPLSKESAYFPGQNATLMRVMIVEVPNEGRICRGRCRGHVAGSFSCLLDVSGSAKPKSNIRKYTDSDMAASLLLPISILVHCIWLRPGVFE